MRLCGSGALVDRELRLAVRRNMDWREAIRQWRALPEAEKRRRRWRSIPRRVAESFAFEGEPVNLAMLEAEHARWAMPPVVLAAESEEWPSDGRR